MPRDIITIRRRGGYFTAAAGPSSYQGPGDVTSGWLLWAGMRAFSAATAATPTNAFELTYNDTTPVTYQTQSDGTINLAVGSNTFSHTTNLSNHGSPAVISKWYDQSVNANHLLGQSGSPGITLNSIGTFSGAAFTGTAARFKSTSAITTTQPFSISVVAKVTSSAAQVDFCTNGAGTVQANYFPGPDVWYTYAGGAASESNTTGTNNAFHAGLFIFSGTSSNMRVDSVDGATTNNIGPAVYSNELVWVGADSGGSFPLTGTMMEVGVNSGNLSGVKVAVNSNPHTVYVF